VRYLACQSDLPPGALPGDCPDPVWVEQQVVTLDKSYFPDLSPSEVYALSGAILLLFASAYAWKFSGRVIRD